MCCVPQCAACLSALTTLMPAATGVVLEQLEYNRAHYASVVERAKKSEEEQSRK